MTTEIGHASLGIIPSFDGFERKLDQGTSKAMLASGAAGGTKFGDAAGKSAGSRFGSVFKTAAKASLVGVAALGVGAFKLAKDSIGAASDLEESTNKVRQVFGKGADSVFRFSEKASDALGQTNQQARDAAATFGLFGNIAGLSDKKSAKFATRMTRLASDLASFHNTEPSQAVEALGAALRGEAEPIRSFGVLLDEATLKAEAMRLGLLKPVKDQAKIRTYQVGAMKAQQALNEATAEFGPKSIEALDAQAKLGSVQGLLQKATEGTIPPLTQQQKVLAAQSSIFKQTKVAQGDFARTSDGLANQQRRLSARFEDAKAKLGVGLLPIMTDAADFLLDKGIPAFEDFSEWFNKKGLPAIGNFADEAKDAWGEVKKLAGFLNDLPKSVKIGGLASVLALVGGAKLRGGGGGVLGTTGKVLGLAKPVPVFVTNPNFGGGGPGGGGGPKVPPVIGPNGAPKVPGKIGRAVTRFAPILPAAGAVGNDTLPPLMSAEDVKDWERKTRTAGEVFNDAWSKVRTNVVDGQSEAEQATAKFKDLFGTLEKVDKTDPTIKPTAIGLAALLGQTKEYKGILEGIPREVRTTFVRSVVDNNTVEDGSDRGGKTPAPPGDGRTAGVSVHIESVTPYDSREFFQDIQRRSQAAALIGRRP